MTHTIDNSADIIDSRDVITRIEELESERDTLADAIPECERALEDSDASDETERDTLSEELDAARNAVAEWDADNGDELTTLRAFASEGEGSFSDWYFGVALVRDSYFENYAQEFAEDIGAINRKTFWPHTCIDWKQAADELRHDYSCIDFDGVTYWGLSA